MSLFCPHQSNLWQGDCSGADKTMTKQLRVSCWSLSCLEPLSCEVSVKVFFRRQVYYNSSGILQFFGKRSFYLQKNPSLKTGSITTWSRETGHFQPCLPGNRPVRRTVFPSKNEMNFQNSTLSHWVSHVHIRIHLHTHIHTYVYIHIYIHIYTYTHT